MKAEDQNLQEVLGGEKQYIVPVFQRRYSWKKKHWNDLWRDILSILEAESLAEDHFIGTFVCMPGDHRPGKVPDYMLIDGQQRMLTFAVILSTIRDHALGIAKEEGSEELRRFSDEIHKKYLVDEYKSGLEKYKIVSRAEDRNLLFKIIDREQIEDDYYDEGIVKSYRFFKENISDLLNESPESRLERLKQIILQQLPLVMITVDEDENPFAIFETLNERGLRLKESDLIRNYVFMKLDPDDQDDFNENIWTPFEKTFERTEEYDAIDLTDFYRDYLMRKGNYVKKNEIYLQFKNRTQEDPYDLADRLKHYSGFYKWIHRPGTAPDPAIGKALDRIDYLDIGTSYPLIIYLLERHQNEEISSDDLIDILHGFESFAIRRSICGESTRGYYLIFPSAIKSIKNENIKESLFKYLLEKGWPKDERFKESLLEFDIYKREKKKCRLILETLEKNFKHKEPVQFDQLTIEHVLPQEIKDDEWGNRWKEMLGDGWEQKHENWKHTIGNLTLTGYNPELSYRPFDDKKDLLEDSHIELNDYFSNLSEWNKETIKARGNELAEKIADIWSRPSL